MGVMSKPVDDTELLSEDDDDEIIMAPATKGKQADQQDLYAELEEEEGKRPSKRKASTPVGEDGENEEDEEDEEEEEIGREDDLFQDDAAKEEAIRQRIAASRLHMRHFLASLTPEQTKRYEAFRRVGFSRPAIKRLMQKVWDQPVNPNAVIVVSGVAKVFVGELVEEARRVSMEMGEATPHGMDPLTPAHLLEAHRRLKARGMIHTSRLCRRRNTLL